MSIGFSQDDMTVGPGSQYRWKGQAVPSVTSILRAGGWSYSGPRPEAVLRAMDRGHKVHAYAHAKDLGSSEQELSYLVSEETVNYIAADLKLRDLFDFELIHGELGLVHPTYQYGGRFDAIGWRRSARLLVDRKTGTSVHPSTWMQLAAYKLLWEFWYPDQPIDRTAAILLQPTTEPRLILNPVEDFAAQCWLAALWRYRWLMRFGGWHDGQTPA